MIESIKIAVYEDEEAPRRIIKQLIEYEPTLQLKGIFENCDHVIADMTECMPEIVLMDIMFEGEPKGLNALITIKSAFPDIPVIMFTSREKEEIVFQCIKSGASGYIKKSEPFHLLLEYIRMIKNGGTMFSPSIAAMVQNWMQNGFPRNEGAINLTPRESEALKFLVDGLSKKLIADRMDITIDGVANHFRRIFDKMQVHSAPEAVRKAIKLRFLERDQLRME